MKILKARQIQINNKKIISQNVGQLAFYYFLLYEEKRNKTQQTYK